MLNKIKLEMKQELKEKGSIDKQKYIEKYKDLFSIEAFETLFSIVEFHHANCK